MPITNCPFTHFGNGIYRPILLIRITNPYSQLSYDTYGIIDTGADECAIPSVYAPLIGHNLQAGQTKHISTGNGEQLLTLIQLNLTFSIHQQENCFMQSLIHL